MYHVTDTQTRVFAHSANWSCEGFPKAIKSNTGAKEGHPGAVEVILEKWRQLSPALFAHPEAIDAHFLPLMLILDQWRVSWRNGVIALQHWRPFLEPCVAHFTA